MRWLLLLLPSLAAARPYVETTGDIGKVTLDESGTLTAAGATAQLTFNNSDAPATLKIVSLGGKRRGIVVRSETEGEDLPWRYRIFLVGKGTLDLVFDDLIVTDLVFSPNGTGRYIESTCARTDKARSRPEIVTLRLVGTAMQRTRRVSPQLRTCRR